MKKILFSFAALAFCVCAAAQYIPDSPDFRVGKLDNGMTYYLYHNENPSGCADFFIAHNVGALQEEDNQNGLAHFLEHMAFNGTKHYPGKGLLKFLADEGVRFGYNVNAYTCRTETVYNVSKVPLVRESFVDSVLMIIHDWSCDISCEQKALDDERGVISEEWRLRDEPRYRMMCRQNELVYKGGKQPERTVLGTMEVINGFKREDILDFYDKWYRPDLQAVIIVGDIDVDAMEAKVRSFFSDITMPENPPRKQDSYLPPKFDGPLCANQTDPSIKYKAFKTIFRQPFPTEEVRHTEEFFRDDFCRQIVTNIVSERLNKKIKEPGCPLQSGVLVTSDCEPDFYTSVFTVTSRSDDNLEAALEYPLREVRRILQHGFTRQEFEAARLAVGQRAHLDRTVSRKDMTSTNLAKVCYENFLRNYPLLDLVDLQSLQKKILAGITFEEVAEYPSKMFEESDVIYSNCINVKDVDKAVSEERILAKVDKVKKENLEPEYLKYPVLDLSVNTVPGTIKSRKTLKGHGIQELTLSNGVKVYYKKSAPVQSDSHLAMEVSFDTGKTVHPKDGIAAGNYASGICRRFVGFRGIDRISQKNYPELSGVTFNISSTDTKSGFLVLAREDRVETAFKSVYLQITEPFMPTEKDMAVTAARTLKNLSEQKNPKEEYREKEEDAFYGKNPWNVRVDSAAVKAVDIKYVEDYFHKAFCDVKTMKVYLCSDEPADIIEEFLCKYIASLPVGAPVKKNKAYPLIQGFKGRTEIGRVNPPISAPVCDIEYDFSRKIRKDTKTRVEVAILDYIMSARYLDLIREERGGAYHVSFETDQYSDPSIPVLSSVSFQTRPELKDILLKDIEDEMQRICTSGPTAQEMDVAVKYFIKRDKENKARVANSLGAQLDQVMDYVLYGVDYDYDYESVIRSISANDIRDLARKISSGDRFISVYEEK